MLLNIGFTPRTPLRRLLNHPLRRLLFSLLDAPIGSIVVLSTRFTFMPSTIVNYAMDVIAAEAAELWICVAVTVDLARAAALGNTPSKTGEGFYSSFGAEFVVPVAR